MNHDPWTNDDRATAHVLRQAFGGVEMTRPLPAISADAAPIAQSPRTRTRRWAASIAAVAAAAAAVTAGTMTLGTAGSAAWAAVPATPTAADAAMAVQECSVPFGPGYTDSSRGDASGVVLPVAISESTLSVLDIRGDGAIAIFSDGEVTASCTIARVDGAWQYAGLMATDTDAVQPLGVAAIGSTEFPGGKESSTITGYADASAVKVEITLSNGTTAEASLGQEGNAQVFAAWFPVSAGDLEGATITAYDAAGGTTALAGPSPLR